MKRIMCCVLGHRWMETLRTQPDCDEDIIILRRCLRCGARDAELVDRYRRYFIQREYAEMEVLRSQRIAIVCHGRADELVHDDNALQRALQAKTAGPPPGAPPQGSRT